MVACQVHETPLFVSGSGLFVNQMRSRAEDFESGIEKSTEKVEWLARNTSGIVVGHTLLLGTAVGVCNGPPFGGKCHPLDGDEPQALERTA